MSADRVPAIVVSLPARTAEAARHEIGEARRAGADLAEIRLDRWDPSELERVDALFPSDVPLLATYRSTAEGGGGANDAASRRKVLLRLAGLPFRWIDLEFERDLGLLPELPPPERLGRIVSSHSSEASPERWGRRLHELAALDAVGKMVVRATVRELFRDLLPRFPPPEEGLLVVHTVGPSGPLLRAYARRLGFPFVYAAPAGSAPRDAVEPSQVPVDRLAPFLNAAEPAPLFAVVGHPVVHSKSPELHTRWMRAAGVAGLYILLDFQDETEFVECLPDLSANGFLGLNVTHPFKVAALEAAHEVAPGAARCGASNCLTIRRERIEAENTDLVAALRRLQELREDGHWTDDTLTVVGAGGAARASLAAAAELSARASVVARRADAARALAREFGVPALEPGEEHRAGLVVHATDAGRSGAGALSVPLAPLLRRGAHLLDWVYAPDDPSVRAEAVRAGTTYEDGWRLLVYQAAASYALWWGKEPEPRALGETLVEGGCAA